MLARPGQGYFPRNAEVGSRVCKYKISMDGQRYNLDVTELKFIEYSGENTE